MFWFPNIKTGSSKGNISADPSLRSHFWTTCLKLFNYSSILLEHLYFIYLNNTLRRQMYNCLTHLVCKARVYPQRFDGLRIGPETERTCRQQISEYRCTGYKRSEKRSGPDLFKIDSKMTRVVYLTAEDTGLVIEISLFKHNSWKYL